MLQDLAPSFSVKRSLLLYLAMSQDGIKQQLRLLLRLFDTPTPIAVFLFFKQ